ncbi:MAG: translation initiation factor eIF-1A [Candidatus Micrarchaeota archaeon]
MVDHNEGQVFRLRLPRRGEIFGVVRELYGGSRMLVDCADGKQRIARIPGKIKRRIWIRAGDIVLVIPWTVESDEKADIAYRYTHTQVDALRRQGILKN